jgi:SAM-dependent methyltransferase
MSKKLKAYETDLAYVHDVGFGGFSRDSTPGLLKILRQCGIRSGRIVDLGCGSGIWARALADAGYDVVGVDLSPAMIEMARKRLPEGRFQVGSFTTFRYPKCEAITALGEVFNYLFDRGLSRAALRRVFQHAYRALSPGGVFVFDVGEPALLNGPDRRFAEGDNWAVLVRYEADRMKNRLTRHIVTFRRIGRTYRRSEETHVVQLYRGEEIAKLLRDVGFRIRPVRGYGTYRFRQGVVGLIARKP